MLKIKSLYVFKLALTILVIFNASGQTVVEIKGNQNLRSLNGIVGVG